MLYVRHVSLTFINASMRPVGKIIILDECITELLTGCSFEFSWSKFDLFWGSVHAHLAVFESRFCSEVLFCSDILQWSYLFQVFLSFFFLLWPWQHLTGTLIWNDQLGLQSSGMMAASTNWEYVWSNNWADKPVTKEMNVVESFKPLSWVVSH